MNRVGDNIRKLLILLSMIRAWWVFEKIFLFLECTLKHRGVRWHDV